MYKESELDTVLWTHRLSFGNISLWLKNSGNGVFSCKYDEYDSIIVAIEKEQKLIEVEDEFGMLITFRVSDIVAITKNTPEISSMRYEDWKLNRDE